MNTPPLNRQCLGDHIKRKLMERIISGELDPGERLVELTLAREFDTSQTPVREALRDLEALRMVESVPHKGVRVREVSDAEMDEAYALRGLLEEYAAVPAAAALKGNSEAIECHVAGLYRSAAAGDALAYAEHDLRFHRAIVEASGNKLLLMLWDSLAFEFRIRLAIFRTDPDLVAVAPQHDEILKALLNGDGLLAGRLLREHATMFISLPRRAKTVGGHIG